MLFIFILALRRVGGDVVHGRDGVKHFGIGVGTLVLVAERRSARAATPLAAIRCGIWSADFWIEPSKAPACAKGYACVSCLNRRHMLWAWISLFWVGFADVYVRLCSMGIWHDFVISNSKPQPNFSCGHQLRNI